MDDGGGGTTEVAVISLGGIVFSRSIRIGGDRLDEAIIAHMKRRHSLLIGCRTAELIKIKLGTAYPDDHQLTMEVKGRDVVAGVPKVVEVSSDEIREAINEPVTAICETVRIALERTPPELASDIVDRGIMLTGGGALLRNIDVRLGKETGVPVHIAEDALCGTVLGAGRVLEHLDTMKQMLAH